MNTTVLGNKRPIYFLYTVMEGWMCRKKRQVDGQVCFLESKSAGLFVSLHVLSGKPSCMTICSGDSFWLLKETRIECTFHVQMPQTKKTSALRLSEIHIYLLQTKTFVMELMEHLFKVIGLPHKVYLIEGAFSPDVI